MLFYLTNSFLDISSGVLWWITKKSVYGVYSGGKYMIYGSEDLVSDVSETKDIDDQIKLLQTQINILSKTLEAHNNNKFK